MENTVQKIILNNVPGAVKEALVTEAERERRSVTAQVIRILEERYGLVETDKEAA